MNGSSYRAPQKFMIHKTGFMFEIGMSKFQVENNHETIKSILTTGNAMTTFLFIAKT